MSVLDDVLHHIGAQYHVVEGLNAIKAALDTNAESAQLCDRLGVAIGATRAKRLDGKERVQLWCAERCDSPPSMRILLGDALTASQARDLLTALKSSDAPPGVGRARIAARPCGCK